MNNIKTITLDVRWYRGLDIALTRRIVYGGRVGDHYQYAYVQSQYHNDKWYKVTADGRCECDDAKYRGANWPCKHIYAVILKAGVPIIK